MAADGSGESYGDSDVAVLSHIFVCVDKFCSSPTLVAADEDGMWLRAVDDSWVRFFGALGGKPGGVRPA